jgi:hypothetical protein
MCGAHALIRAPVASPQVASTACTPRPRATSAAWVSGGAVRRCRWSPISPPPPRPHPHVRAGQSTQGFDGQTECSDCLPGSYRCVHLRACVRAWGVGGGGWTCMGGVAGGCAWMGRVGLRVRGKGWLVGGACVCVARTGGCACVRGWVGVADGCASVRGWGVAGGCAWMGGVAGGWLWGCACVGGGWLVGGACVRGGGGVAGGWVRACVVGGAAAACRVGSHPSVLCRCHSWRIQPAPLLPPPSLHHHPSCFAATRRGWGSASCASRGRCSPTTGRSRAWTARLATTPRAPGTRRARCASGAASPTLTASPSECAPSHRPAPPRPPPRPRLLSMTQVHPVRSRLDAGV